MSRSRTAAAAAPATTSKTVNFVVERETKGAVRYEERDENGNDPGAWAVIGSLYVRKTAFPPGTTSFPPLKVTVEW